MKDLVKRLFAAIDKKDADAFVSFLTEDAAFYFANAPVVKGRESIHNAVAQFFSALKGLQHSIQEIWESGSVVICEGKVKYTRINGSELTIPFADIFRMEGDLIKDYRIYMDASLLFT